MLLVFVEGVLVPGDGEAGVFVFDEGEEVVFVLVEGVLVLGEGEAGVFVSVKGVLVESAEGEDGVPAEVPAEGEDGFCGCTELGGAGGT